MQVSKQVYASGNADRCVHVRACSLRTGTPSERAKAALRKRAVDARAAANDYMNPLPEETEVARRHRRNKFMSGLEAVVRRRAAARTAHGVTHVRGRQAEEVIRDAMVEGEFDNLPGQVQCIAHLQP